MTYVRERDVELSALAHGADPVVHLTLAFRADLQALEATAHGEGHRLDWRTLHIETRLVRREPMYAGQVWRMSMSIEPR